MKNLYLPACFIFFTFYYSQCLAQNSNCNLSAATFVKLVGARINVIEDILMPCYSVIEDNGNDNAQILLMRYRMDYGGTGNNMDYNIIDIFKSGNIGFITTSVSTYKFCKQELIKYGFKYIRDDYDNSPLYTLGKLDINTHYNKNADGDILYTIQFFKHS